MQSQKLDSKKKTNHTIRSRCARAWIVMDGMETPFVWSLSLYKFFWEHGYLFYSSFFFLFHGPSCAHIFFILFFQYLDLHVSIFFFDSPCLSFFLTKTGERERPTHIVEHLFCGMSGWYNANFSKKHSKGVCGVHVNLDHESMKRILSRVTTIWHSSVQKQAAYVYVVFKKYHHMALVGLWHIKEELCKGFPNFQIKIPST